MLEHCTYGTKLRLYGTNAHVAKFSGINTTSLLFRTHITSSICAALGGLMMLATYSSARADYGTNYTMQSILLVVLGGVSRMVVKWKNFRCYHSYRTFEDD